MNAIDKKFIPAIKKLLKHYSKYKGTRKVYAYGVLEKIKRCPLCKIDKRFKDDCTACPWYLLEKKTSCGNNATPQEHIARLNRWLTIINK